MKFGELVRHARSDLVVSRRYDEWMRKNPNPHYSDEAIMFAERQLVSERTPRDRRGGVSASAVGKCIRRQQFTFMGMPEMDTTTPKSAAILTNGTFMHLRWQMTGLTEGFLTEAEVPLGDNEYRISGTMDGICYDGSIIDFKSANERNFSRACTFGPLEGHKEQIGTYVLAHGAEKAILLYESKNTQEYKEIVIPREELGLEATARRVEQVWEACESQRLAKPLDALYAGKAPCSYCPFIKVCDQVEDWEQAEEVRDGIRAEG